jgi:hypothetical protein
MSLPNYVSAHLSIHLTMNVCVCNSAVTTPELKWEGRGRVCVKIREWSNVCVVNRA